MGVGFNQAVVLSSFMVTPANTFSSASHSPAPSQQKRLRYNSVDGWRGVACLMIVITHSLTYAFTSPPNSISSTELAPFNQTIDLSSEPSLVIHTIDFIHRFFGVGVHLFFVISGYCISAAVDNARQKGMPAKTYFWRRFRRIYPPCWLLLLLTLLGMVLVHRPELYNDPNNLLHQWYELSAWQWIGNFTLTESWRYHLLGDARAYIAGQTWTLCYEEQFYLVMGIIYLFCPRRMFLGAAIVSLFTVFMRLGVKLFGWQIDGFFFDGHWLLFALGIGVYYYLNYAERLWKKVFVLFLPLVFVALLAVPVQADLKIEYGAGLLFALVLITLFPWDKKIEQSKLYVPFHFCGLMCYSLYLTHWPVVLTINHAFYLHGIHSPTTHFFLVLPICLVASLGLSWLFYVLVERKFLNS